MKASTSSPEVQGPSTPLGGSDSQARVPRWHLHRRLYDWVLQWAYTPYALLALVLISFAESSFFPIPPDVLLIALVAGATHKWWRFATWCTAASVLGGIFGYLIGMYFWEGMGQWIMENIIHTELVAVDGRLDINLPSYLIDAMGSSLGGSYLFQVYDVWNAWIVLVFGLTPLPYKLVTISAGVAQINFPIFVLASVVSRALRFFAVALILRLWGDLAKRYIERYFNLMATIFVLLLIGSYFLIAFVF